MTTTIFKRRINIIIAGTLIGFLMVAETTLAAWNQELESTVEINDGTTNGPTLSDSDSFGGSVVNIGDLNGDGVNDIAVGASDDDNGGAGRGAVHIMFMNTDGSIDSTVEINDTTTNGPVLNDNDSFGKSVTSLGDLDGDGVQDLAVGAFGDDNGGTSRGAIHILFMNTDGSLDSTVEINSSTTNGPTLSNWDSMGRAISNIGDLDGDGVVDIASNMKGYYDGDHGPGVYRGAVAIMFMNTDGSIDSTVEITGATANGPSLVDYQRFGSSITGMDDLDGDGVNDIAVGSYGYLGTTGSSVNVLFMNTDGSIDSTVEITGATANGPVLSSGDYFGNSVENIGDLDGNGVVDLAVGADGDDNGGSGRGAVHIIYLSTTGGSSLRILNTEPKEPTLSTNVVDSTTIDLLVAHKSYNIYTNELGFTYKTEDEEEKVAFYTNKKRLYNGTKHFYSLNNLQCNTEYEIQSYAENKKGTVYSDIQSVTTNMCKENDTDDDSNGGGLSSELTFSYLQQLQSGDENSDVKRLQTLLNNFGFFVATEGPGSPGNETNFYGSLTSSAISKLQAALALPVTGQVDETTLQIINILQIIWDMGL